MYNRLLYISTAAKNKLLNKLLFYRLLSGLICVETLHDIIIILISTSGNRSISGFTGGKKHYGKIVQTL